MTSANANVTVNTIVDKAFESAMAGMQRSMSQTITSINGFNRSQRSANTSGGAIARTLNQISKEGRGLSSSFARVKADMAGLDAAFKKNRAVIAQLESSIKQLEAANRKHGLSTKTGFDTAPLKAYKSQLESVNKMQKELTNTQKAMNFMELGKKFNKSAQSLSYAGMRMTYGLSLPIATFLRTGFQSLKALDKEVIRTGKLIADGFSTGAAGVRSYNRAMADLDTRLDKLSISWGVSRELVQGLAGDFAEIGISDPKALARLTQFTAEFEKLGNVDITQAQQTIQSIYQQIARVRRDQGLPITGKGIEQMIEEVRGAIAFFNFAENKTTLSLKDMADAFPEVSAAATSFGLNMQTTAALLVPMVGAGFQVGASANSIKVSLQRLVAPTKKNQDIIKALSNVLGKDFRLSTKIGAEGIQDLIDGYTKLQDKLGDAGALTFFAELFGVRQGPRMEVAIKQMSEYQQELDKAGSAERLLAKDLEQAVNKQLRLASLRNRSIEGRQVEFIQLNKIKDIQDLIGQSQEKTAGGQFTERALAIQKAQEAEVKRLKENNSEIDKGNNLLGERFDKIKTESGKILSGAMFGTALTSETLEEELTRVQGSLQVRYGRARESIKSIARELTVVFGDLLNAINPILEKISAWIQLLPSGTKKLIGVVLILLAALGPVLRTLGAASQIAGTFAMTRGKGILKFRNDVISLNGTLVESSNLLTRLGGKFTKIGKDGTFFGTRRDLKRLEAAAPIQEKIDAGQRLSFAEKSIYKKSIKGLIGRKEYLRVQMANATARGTSPQDRPLDQAVLPTGSANVSGFDIRSITTAQNLANPIKAIRDFTINLIKKMEQAVVNSANRASRKTRTPLNPRVGANTAAAAAAAAAAGGPTVQTPSRRTAQSQSKPVSSQYYTKLMSILQAIQKCICSPGKVVGVGGGRPGGGQPASPNAPPAPQPTTPRPTTSQPVTPQPAGGGQSAPSPRNRPVTPSAPKPKQTGSFPVLETILATQVAQTQQQVVSQVEQDIQQATNVVQQTKTSTKKAKDSVVKVSKKVTLTKDLILNIMKEAGVVIPQQFQEMKDFEVVIQKQIFEKIKAILSSTTGAADFLSGKIKSISGTVRAGSYDKTIKEALGIGRERISPKAIKKERDITHVADIRASRVNQQYEIDREHFISVGKKHLATVDRLENEINTIANQIDIARKTGDQKEVERLESLGRDKTRILARVQQAIEQNILKIQALSSNVIRDSYLDFIAGQNSRRAAGLESFGSRSQARGFARKEGLRYTDVAYYSPAGRGKNKTLEDRKSFGFAPKRELTEEDKQRRQRGLSEAYQRRQEIRTGVRVTAADIGMPKPPTAKEMTESTKKFTSRFEAGEGSRIQAQAASAYDEVLKIKKEILNLTTKLDKTKEKLGNIAVEIQDLESKAPKGKLRSPKAIAKNTARLERIEKLNTQFNKTYQAIQEQEKQLADANTRLQAIQGTASGYKPTASSVGTGGFRQPNTVQATTPLEETGLIVKGPEKITAAAKKALKAQIVGFEKEIKLIEEKIAEYQTFKGSNVAKEKIADLERLKTQLLSQIKQAEAKLAAALPKISGGAFGFNTVIEQLKAALNLPEQKFQELITELQTRAPKTTAGLNAPIAKVKGDVSKVVEAIKATVLSGDQSLDSLYNAVMSQRNILAKWADQAASTSPVKPTGVKETRDQIRARIAQVAEQIKITGASVDSLMSFTQQELRYLAEFVAGTKRADASTKPKAVQAILQKLTELGVATDIAIQETTVKPIDQATQATKPKTPRQPRTPKPSTPSTPVIPSTPSGIPMPTGIIFPAIPLPQNTIPSTTPVTPTTQPAPSSPGAGFNQSIIAAAVQNAIGSITKYPNIAQVKQDFINFGRFLSNATTNVKNFAVSTSNIVGPKLSSAFDTAKMSVLNFAKKLNTPFGGNKIEKGIISGFINPIRSAGSMMSSSIKKYMNYQLFYKNNKQPSFGGATIGEILKATLKRGGTAFATAGYSEIFRGGRGIVRAAKETPQYMYAKEKIKEKVPQYIDAFKKYGKDVAAQFKPSIDAFKSETIPAFKNGFANVRKYLREPFEASIQAFKSETIPAYLKGFQKIKSALDQVGSLIKNSAAGQAFINEAIPAYKKAISTAGSAIKNAVLNAGAFSAAVGKAGFDIAKKTFTLDNLKKASSIVINNSKTAIRIAYNIEKEIIKLPVTSTVLMAKGLQKAGLIVASIWKQFKTTNFAQNTAIGSSLVKTAAGISSGVKAVSSAVVDAAAMAVRASIASATFAKNIATLNWDKAATQVASGLGKLANGIIGGIRTVAVSTGKAVVNVAKATAQLADKIVGLGRRAVVATASIAARPVTAVSSAFFGVGRGPQYQKDSQGQIITNQFGGQTQKMGLFRKDRILDASGQQVGKGPGFIGKTMKGVGGAFKGAIGMGGQMASMLTYQLGPAGMLLAGPMNKVIGLMQRFSKVSAPILIIITAISLAIMVLKKTFENMGGKAQNIMDNFKAAFENIKAVFGMLVGVFKDFFASLFGNGAKDAEEGGENIRQVVGSISEKVLAFTEKFKAFFEKTLEPVIRKVLSGVSLAIKGIIGFIGPVIQFIKNLVGYFKGGGEESKKEMSKAFDGMKEAAGKVFTGLITIFKTPFIFLIDIVFKVLGLITNIFERMADGIIIVIQYLIKGIINGFFAIPRGVVAIVQEVVRIWTNLQKALVDIAKESVKFIIKALFTLTNGAVSLVGKLISIFGALIAGWGKILDKMSELFIQWMNNILDFAARQDGFFGAFLDFTGVTALSKGFKFIVGIAGKGLSAIGSVYESVGNKINEITNSVTSGLSNGLAAAEGKALSFTDSVGNGIKAVLSSVRDIFELGDDVLKVAQDAALSGVDNVANNVRDAIGSSSDWVVGIGKGIKDWINGLTTAKNIGKGIGKDVGGKEDNTNAQTPSQAVASGITIAEAIDEATKALKRGFFDKVIDSLSNAINKFKDKFREGLEKQKQDVLKFFDDQVAAIDALAEAEERLTATKEYEENRRLKIAERALQRDSYVKQRALAIYEGRIDDARLLSLQEEKDNRDFNKDLGKMDEDRNKTLQSQNREQAKKVIQQQKEQLSEKFDKDIKNFEQFVESIGKNGTLTKDQLTEQFKALQTEALKTSGDMKEAFQTYYTALPGLIQQNTDPTVGAFNMSLDTLIQAAATKYGTDVNSKDPASLLGITGLMLSGTSQAYTDGFNNSIIPAYSAGISEITKIGTDFNDPKNPNSPQNVYAKAISDANEAMVAEFYKMKTDATSAFAQVVDGLNAEAKRLAVEEAIRSATEQIDEEEKKRKRREDAEKALSGGTGEKSSPMGISRKMFLAEAGKDKVFKLGDTDEIIAAAKAKLIEYQMLPADTELSQKFDQPMKKALLAFQKKYLAKEMKNPQGNLGAGTAKALGLLGSAGVQKKYYGGSVKKSMAIGGIVPGFAQQGVPAILHGGEYVINSKAVSGLGQMFLNYINEFKFGIPRYTTPKIAMPQMGNQFKTEVIKTENETIHNYNFYVDNFIGEDQWFESMMKNYNVKVLPNKQKAAGLESRVVRTYSGINKGM